MHHSSDKVSATTFLTIAGSEYVGYSGAGLFQQAGGTHTIGNTLYLAYKPGATGTLNLSGGSLAAQSERPG